MSSLASSLRLRVLDCERLRLSLGVSAAVSAVWCRVGDAADSLGSFVS